MSYREIRAAMLTWEQVKAEFEWDGSLRDLYVWNTSIEDWDRLLNAVRSHSYPVEFLLGGELAALPEKVSDIFAITHDKAAFLGIDVSGLRVHSHFFTLEEIEMDLDPRQFRGQKELDALLTFMRFMGQALNREVIMTPENCPDIAVFIYAPDSDAISYTQFGGWR